MTNAGGGIHLVDIHVRPCAFIKDVIDGSWQNLQQGVEKGNGRTLYGFKVIGENRLIAILDSGIECALASLNMAYGDQTKVTCTPLRTYEGFAEHVLGADSNLARTQYKQLASDCKDQFYWLVFNVTYRGKSATDLIKIWLQDATTILTLRSKSDMQVELFKVVGQREIHSFWKVRDAELIDDFIFTLPLMKDLGDQVQVTSKSIALLPQTLTTVASKVIEAPQQQQQQQPSTSL